MVMVDNRYRYFGEIKDGLAHGLGELWYFDGSRFTGQFRNGISVGVGRYSDKKYTMLGHWDGNGSFVYGEVSYHDNGYVSVGEFTGANLLSGEMKMNDGTVRIGRLDKVTREFECFIELSDEQHFDEEMATYDPSEYLAITDGSIGGMLSV